MWWEKALALYAVLPAAAALWFVIFWSRFDFWRRSRTLTYVALSMTFLAFGATEAMLRDWVFTGQLELGIVVALVGWLVIAIATVFGTVADRQIGFRVRSFTPFFEHQPRLDLKTTGAYGVVRHPIYAAGIAFQVGAFLVTGYPSVLVACAVFATGAMWFTRQEEKRLVALLDDPRAYDRYRQRVPALLPLRRRGASR